MKKLFPVILILFSALCAAQKPDNRGIVVKDSKTTALGKTYAIIIGISKYKDVNALKYSDRDATVFADFLLDKKGMGLDSSNVQLFVNEKATLNNIGNALSDIMIRDLKKGDRIIFFFAGHGDYDANIFKDQALLLLYAAPKENYFKNIFSGDFISTADLNSRFVEPVAAKGCEVILIVDACHATGLNKKLSGGEEGGKITAMALQNMTSPVKLYSCQPNEYSLESEQWGAGRGLFSFVLMEGLYGMADADNNKTVTLRELQRYLEDNIPTMAAPNKQNPVVKADDATQLMSKVDDALLAKYKLQKDKGLTFIAKVDTKGNNENWLQHMDTSMQRLYRECERLMEKQQLDAAYEIFLVFVKKDSSSAASIQLRRNLSAALQKQTADILVPVLENIDNVVPMLNDDKIFIKAEVNLEKAMQLLGEKNFLYQKLLARCFFLKAYDLLLHRKMHDIPQIKKVMANIFESLKLEPNAPYCYFQLGWTHAYEDLNLDSSNYYYEKYLGLVPKSWVVYNNLGNNFWGQKKYDLAETYYLRSLKFLPAKPIEIDSNSIYETIGYVFVEAQNKEKALKYFQLANAQKPDTPRFLENVGGSFITMKLYDSALYYYRIFQQMYPALDSGYNGAAYTFMMIERYDSAEIYYRKAAAISPDDEDNYYNLGCSLIKQNKPVDSAFHYWNLLFQKVWLKNKHHNVYRYLKIISNDHDMDPVRTLPGFKALLKKYYKQEDLDLYPDLFIVKPISH